MSWIDLWYTTRATGLAALVLLSATMVLGLLTAGRTSSPRWPGFARAELHKRVSAASIVFLAIHVLTSILDSYVHIGWASIVMPFVSSYNRFWTGLGTVGVDLMAAVAISSALRRRIPPRLWRSLHWLAYGSWPVAVAHAVGEGTDMRLGPVDALVAVCVLAVIGAAALRAARWRMAGAARPALVAAQLRRTHLRLADWRVAPSVRHRDRSVTTTTAARAGD